MRLPLSQKLYMTTEPEKTTEDPRGSAIEQRRMHYLKEIERRSPPKTDQDRFMIKVFQRLLALANN